MAPTKKVVERGVWSEEEHDKFLAALKVYPKGPWKLIAVEVGTRSARQVQTHAQKYFEKIARRVRGLRKDRKKVVRLEHRLGDDAMRLCQVSDDELHGGSASARATSHPSQQQHQQDQQQQHQQQHIDAIAVGISTAMPVALAASAASAAAIGGSNRRSADDESFMALLLAHQDALTLQDNSDSDDPEEDALASVDDYYLDFLIQALSSEDFGDLDLDGESSSSSSSGDEQ